MLISYDRYSAASERLAMRKLRRVVRDLTGPVTPEEKRILFKKAILPWAWVKIARRLFDRGHVILDQQTGEIFRCQPKP
jgi:hypothetical protein